MPVNQIGIIGGGIVGLSTAFKLSQRYPEARIILLEKEKEVAQHQTGRNSGVIHSGIYYKPGSLKATTCRDGKAQLEAFCEEHSVAYEVCGKVIVAKDESEVATLQRIFERGQANGVACTMISREELLEIEPHVRGVQAIRVTETGIVDYVGFCNKLSDVLQKSGHVIRLAAKVTGIQKNSEGIRIQTEQDDFQVQYLVNCAGLYSDKVAQMAGFSPKVKIVPFRGEYFELTPEAEHLCKHLIYPCPDPNFPFLGVHFTRMVLGGVECGPNAVLAFAREGYTNKTVNVPELVESLTYSGFLKMMPKVWKMGMGEMHRSFSKKAFTKALQSLIPEVQEHHLNPGPAGVRAQALDRTGALVDDFAFEQDERAVHVINAPSPAATATLAIADHIVNLLSTKIG